MTGPEPREPAEHPEPPEPTDHSEPPQTEADAPLLGITGSTGTVGRMVAHLLAAAGRHQRLLVRDRGRAPLIAQSEIAVTDYSNSTTAVAALEGVHTLFMVSAAEAEDRVGQHCNFIDAAVSAGVKNLVYLSFYGAAADSTFTLGRDHWATEEHLRSTGLSHVILRDNLYLDFLPGLVGEDGAIRGPARDGRVAAVAQRDIAAAAASILLDPAPHLGRTYALTGPEALSLSEVADIVGDAQGRPVRYIDETVEEAFASRQSYGAPPWQVEAWVSTYTSIAVGEMAGISDDVRLLTGRAPTSLRELLEAVN